jgi:methionine synthase II (cobalamin-independent)
MTIRTTCVGSWPPPFGQRPALRPFWRGEVDETDPAIEAALTAGARIAMDEMLACGLDQITGGEVFTPDFVHTVPPRLEGLSADVRRDISRGQQGVARYRVTGPVSAPRGMGHGAAWARESAIEPRLDKAAIPSPFTITLSLVHDDALAGAMDELVEVVRGEIATIAAPTDAPSGVRPATEIQLDAPSEAIACAHGTHPVGQLAEWIAAPFDGFDGTRSVHFCLGDIARKPSTQVQNLHSLVPLLQALDGHIDRAHLECSYAGQWDDRALLADIPDSIEIIAGIADVKDSPAPVGELAERIASLLELVPENRLLVSSSCGCGRVPHDDAIRLMRNLVKAAAAG